MRAHHKKRTKNSREREIRQRRFVVNLKCRPEYGTKQRILADEIDRLHSLGFDRYGYTILAAEALGLEYSNLSALRKCGFMRWAGKIYEWQKATQSEMRL